MYGTWGAEGRRLGERCRDTLSSLVEEDSDRASRRLEVVLLRLLSDSDSESELPCCNERRYFVNHEVN